MKFVQAEIYGFGKWIDTQFDFSKAPLICIYGENESGKSTLQQFILYMLFGLPPRLRNFYKPKSSNRIGGKLTVHDERAGTFTIERVGDEMHCLLESGEQKDEAWLQGQLNGLTREIYTAIYAFSALELTEIRTMKEEELSNVLFSVGLTGATNIHKVEKQLETKLGGLYKKNGRIPMINKQINEVRNIHLNMVRFKEKEGSYRQKKEEQATLTEAIETCKQQIATHQEQLLYYEKVHHIVPLVTDYQQVVEKLATLPKEIPFPEDGVARLEQLRANILPLKSELAILHTNEQQYREKLAEVAKHIYEDIIYEQAADIVKQKQSYEHEVKEMAEIENSLDSIEREISERLNDVALEKADIEEVILPFHLEASWKSIAETDQYLTRDQEKLEEDIQLITEETKRLRAEDEALEKKILSEEEVQQIKTAIQKYDTYHIDIEKYETQQQGFQHWETKRTKTAKTVVTAAGAFAILSFFIGLFVNPSLFFTVSVLLIIAGLSQFFFINISVKDMEQNMIEKPDRNIISDIERSKYAALLQEQEQLQTEKRLLEGELKRINFNQLQWEERKRLYTQRRDSWLDQLETEKFQYPFLKRIAPAHWVDVLQMVQHVKKLLLEQKQLDAQWKVLREQIDEFIQSLSKFATEMNRTSITLDQVEEILESGLANKSLLAQYKELQRQNVEKQIELQEAMAVYQHELDALLEIAEVKEEEDFLKAAKALEEQERWQQEKRKIETQISTMFPDAFTEKLLEESFHSNEIELEITQLRTKMKKSESILADANKQLAAVEMELKQMEMSDDNSKTTFKYQMAHEKLNELAKEWAVLKVAQTTLQRAKNAYQKKHLKEVMRTTSKYFKQLTGGKYVQVFAPTATMPFQVEATNYTRYTVEELSQGTIDQLYVSLRLAISRVMGDTFVIPLMIDDAFVHFDEQRTTEMLQLMSQISEERQILFFTCKQAIADQLQANHLIHDIRVGSYSK